MKLDPAYQTLLGWTGGQRPNDSHSAALVVLGTRGSDKLLRIDHPKLKGLDRFIRECQRPHKHRELWLVKLGGWGYWDELGKQRRFFPAHEFVLEWNGGQVYHYQASELAMTLEQWLAGKRHCIDWTSWLADFSLLHKETRFNAQRFARLFGITHCGLFEAPLRQSIMDENLEFSIFDENQF